MNYYDTESCPQNISVHHCINSVPCGWEFVAV